MKTCLINGDKVLSVRENEIYSPNINDDANTTIQLQLYAFFKVKIIAKRKL